MNILDWLLPGRHDALVLELAQRIATEQQDRVWQQLSARAGSIASVSEAKGYIRFRALHLLQDGLISVADSTNQLNAVLCDRIVERAADLLAAELVGPMVGPQHRTVDRRQAA